jgi:hypothetical protein
MNDLRSFSNGAGWDAPDWDHPEVAQSREHQLAPSRI